MADTFYADNLGTTGIYRTDTITVATTTTSAQPLELRVTNGTVTAKQVYDFLEKMADFFSDPDVGVVVAGTLIG